MDEPTCLDLFSGIGGFSLAAAWAGFRTIGFSEVDPYASAVLRKHWPAVPNFGDVRRFADWPDIGDVSLLTGGFPCQPHSLAGKCRGAGDDRYLWPAMRDVIGRYRPAWVCGENVPGILGVELDKVLSSLESLGYRVQPLVIPACAVDAPHRRDRVWIVAHAERAERRTEDDGRGCAGEGKDSEGQAAGRARECGEVLAHTIVPGLEKQCQQSARQERQTAKRSREAVSYAESNGRDQGRAKSNAGRARVWPTEPDVGRVAHGISRRVDRLRCLGNAIVPQVAFQILREIRKLI